MYDYGYYNNDSAYELAGILGVLGTVFVIVLFIALAIAIVQIIGQWKLYKKAGKGGWEAIVPFYCNWVLVEIAGLKWYWFLSFFAPVILSCLKLDVIGWLVYLFGMFNIFYNISKKFNKGIWFAICLTLFTPICICILGFSRKAVYDKNVVVSPNGVFGFLDNNGPNTKQQNVVPTPVMPVQEVSVQTQDNQTVSPAFCSNCGNKLNNTDKFCTKCGKQI